jgi:hypothetical protein
VNLVLVDFRQRLDIFLELNHGRKARVIIPGEEDRRLGNFCHIGMVLRDEAHERDDRLDYVLDVRLQARTV